MTNSPSLSLEDSNRRLPLVRLIARDAIKSKKKLVLHQQELSELTSMTASDKKQPSRPDSSANQDVAHVHILNKLRETIQTEEKTLERCHSELQQVGARLVDAATGLVEFPSTLDGKQVSLSWQFDEPEVAHFRSASDDDRIRHPLHPSHQISG